MLTIQDLLKKVYCCIKNISKKAYRDCAVLVSGFTVVALISLNTHAFGGAGKNRMIIQECSSTREVEADKPEEEAEQNSLFAGPDFAAVCRNALEEQSKIKQEEQAEVEQLEVVTVCANLEPMYNELPQKPVNPYGDICLSDKDYEALCRIVQAEAGGEEEKGKILVAEVILNRVLNEEFADSVYDVVFERTGGSAQFAPTVDGRYYTVEVTPETVEAVEKALYGEDYSDGALFFSARSKANPYDMAWFDRNLKWLFQYGGHEFYTLP